MSLCALRGKNYSTKFHGLSSSRFTLIDANRRILYYVTGEPGVSLSPYLERWVELFGVTEVRGDVRGADYMRVSRVSLVK